jgi:catechol 2,3-dioxygenase-like lactoylglutathione lyase family enzyme
VILHREGQVEPVHRPLLPRQLREGVVRVQLVEHMAVDIDEIAAVAALSDAMKVPDFVEQGSRHGVNIYRGPDESNPTGPMPKVVGIDHLVLSVGDFARSRDFYGKLLKFLGFKLKNDYADMAGWSNGKTLFWIAAADAEGKKHKYRKGDIGFHHYAFELSSRNDVDALGAFLEDNAMTVVDPPGEYYGRDYYAVYFTDPDGMKLEGMIWAPPPPQAKRKPAAQKKAKKKSKPDLYQCR